jgi:hypothetical protein
VTTIVTIDEVADALNLGDTDHYAELEGYIDAASAYVESWMGPMPSATYTERLNATFRPDGSVSFLTGRFPVLAVTSIVRADPYWLTDTPVSYTTDFAVTSSGYISHAAVTDGWWNVTYTAGFATVPADLKLAVLEDIRGLYQPGQIGAPAAFGAFGINSTDTGVTYRPVRMWPRIDAWVASRKVPGIA